MGRLVVLGAATGKDARGEEQVTMHWSVAQIFSKRAHLIRKEVEDHLKHSTMTPTYIRRWYTDGKESETCRPLLPGYLLFQTAPNGWGGVAATEGVIRVLGASGIAGKVRDEEIAKLVVDDYCGTHNSIEATVPAKTEQRERRYARRRPRPRPGKKWRVLMRQKATEGAIG